MNNVKLVAIDWGTSSLRIWLVGENGKALAERRSQQGMIACRQSGFAPVLEAHLAELNVPPGVPVIACGMVGARQGWIEANYIDTKTPLTKLVTLGVQAPFERNPVTILPGVAQRAATAPDVIRGEETQAIGLADAGDALLVMPGTHSKWVELANGAIYHFTTYMTGELYALLSTHSTLAPSLEGKAEVEADDPEFLRALEAAIADPGKALSGLFGLRAGILLDCLTINKARARLSGYLIGAEIGMGREKYTNRQVHLVASGRAAQLYSAGFDLAGLKYQTADAENLVRTGLIRAATTMGMLA